MAAEEVIKQCIFCQMCMGRASSFKVFEDAECIAILDIRPANPGHLLVMPKEHYSILPQIPVSLVEHLFGVVQKLSKVAIQSIGARGTNIIIANGLAAGQRAQHVMIHIIPRADKDGINFMIPQKDHSDEELRNMHMALKKKMTLLTGREHKEEPPIVDVIPKKVEPEMRKEQIEFPKERVSQDDGLREVADLLSSKKKVEKSVDLDKIAKMFGDEIDK